MGKKIKNKIKNLIIFPGNYLPHVGGLETHVDEFVKRLSLDKSYRITIFTPNIMDAKEKEILYSNVNMIRYPAFYLVFNFPFPKFWKFEFWKILINLYKKDFDIVMTRTMFFTNTTLGSFFAKFRLKRIKLMHVEHASDYSKLDSFLKSFSNKFYMQTLGRLTLMFADKLVCVSDGTKDFLINQFQRKESELTVIRRGFNYLKCSKIKENIKLKNKYTGKIIISFVGRLIDGKGVQDVLKALNGITEDYIFLIIGDGQYCGELEKLVNENNLKKNVKFLGKLDHDEVISVLKISDIFVNPSYTEGLPTAVLDGFFTKNKILATDVGGTYEIYQYYFIDLRLFYQHQWQCKNNSYR